jgi:hypothetical protein
MLVVANANPGCSHPPCDEIALWIVLGCICQSTLCLCVPLLRGNQVCAKNLKV